jgi:hypothetical protein
MSVEYDLPLYSPYVLGLDYKEYHLSLYPAKYSLSEHITFRVTLDRKLMGWYCRFCGEKVCDYPPDSMFSVALTDHLRTHGITE